MSRIELRKSDNAHKSPYDILLVHNEGVTRLRVRFQRHATNDIIVEQGEPLDEPALTERYQDVLDDISVRFYDGPHTIRTPELQLLERGTVVLQQPYNGCVDNGVGSKKAFLNAVRDWIVNKTKKTGGASHQKVPANDYGQLTA